MRHGRLFPLLACLIAIFAISDASAQRGASAMYPPRAIRTAATCDPPGPPPRIGRQGSTDAGDRISAEGETIGAAPRASRHSDGNGWYWTGPGYTGRGGTVQTEEP